MSLINDALKRASQLDPAKAPAMEILEPVPSAPPSKLPLIVLPLIFVAALGLGVWFLLRGWQVTRLAQAQETPTIVAARTVAAPPAPEALPTVANPVSPTATAATIVPGTAGTTAGTAAPVAAVPVVEQVPTFPKLRLQAVFLRVSNPAVVVNNRTLGVGDMVENAKVIKITQNSVLMEWEGERREIKLP